MNVELDSSKLIVLKNVDAWAVKRAGIAQAIKDREISMDEATLLREKVDNALLQQMAYAKAKGFRYDG